MSDETEVTQTKTEPVAAKGGVALVPLVLVVLSTVVLVLGAVGGGVYWLSKSGRLPGAGGAAAAATAETKVEQPKTRVVMLDPLLVNLSDAGGSYLRVVVALVVEDLPPAKDAKPKEEKPPEKGKVLVNEDEVKMRDAALTVVGGESSGALLAPDGKDHLKQELRQAIGAHVSAVKVRDVMFTEFLVQK